MLIIFVVLRRVGKMVIQDKAIFKMGELLAYAMALNLFLLGMEVFSALYAPTSHTIHAQYQWWGIDGRTDIAVYTWLALACNSLALIGFMVPVLRNRLPFLIAACGLTIAGVFVEKGLGLLIPGQVPDMLGEVYRYRPNANELLVGAGIWGIGALLFTLTTQVTLAVSSRSLLRSQPSDRA